MSWFEILTLIVLLPLALTVFFIVASLLYLTWYQRWEWAHTSGLSYYGKALRERRALKAKIRRYSYFAIPIVRLLAIGNRQRAAMPTFEYKGVCGPKQVSSETVFARASAYQPQPEDVFVATQMRCGTTWMQQTVYEIVHRGQGNLNDSGHGHLYATCPWIDAVNGVALEDAPLVGQPPTRIIKTHLPTQLCPYSPQAKYIYVTRHPVSCFASIVDFNRNLLGPLMPTIDKMADWFCSDRMYWSPWPAHVAGWWQWAQSRHNVLFIHFEDMKANFSAVLDQIARFLGYALTPNEKLLIAQKCSFQYMKENEELFEMSPPNMFSVAGGRFITSGKDNRYEDVTPVIHQRIRIYCRQALQGADYPAQRFYPDLYDAPSCKDLS